MPRYRGVCRRPTYWLNKQWLVHEIYEGDDKPPKWFDVTETKPKKVKRKRKTVKKKYEGGKSYGKRGTV